MYICIYMCVFIYMDVFTYTQIHGPTPKEMHTFISMLFSMDSWYDIYIYIYIYTNTVLVNTYTIPIKPMLQYVGGSLFS